MSQHTAVPPKPLSLGTEGFSKELSESWLWLGWAFHGQFHIPCHDSKEKAPECDFWGAELSGPTEQLPCRGRVGHRANTFISGHTTALQDRETDLLSWSLVTLLVGSAASSAASNPLCQHGGDHRAWSFPSRTKDIAHSSSQSSVCPLPQSPSTTITPVAPSPACCWATAMNTNTS